MRQPFETSELKAELERSLGFALRTLARLDGASALNFKAVRASDGLAFAVKCSPVARQELFDHLVRHLADLEGTKAVKRLFEGVCPQRFREFNVICLSWCAGERLFPDQLTETALLDFLDDYQAFSAAMQRTSGIVPHDPTPAWRQCVLTRCMGLWGGWIRRLIEREIPESGVTHRREALRVIHGDFHHGNFLFENGHVTGFFDLEEFCEGYPAEDLVRYFVCAAEHLKWYEQGRKRHLLARFRRTVGHLPYSAEEWTVAINCQLVRKLYFKTESRRIGFVQTVNLLFRAGFYRALRGSLASPLDTAREMSKPPMVSECV